MRHLSTLTLFIAGLAWVSGSFGVPKTKEAAEARENLSLRNEVGRAVGRGVKWLASEQNATSGQWGAEEYPALTGLAVRAILGDPARTPRDKYSSGIIKGYSFILSN